MANFIPTNQKIEVENYPYGFKLRTTLYDTIEFNPKKGYRHVTQTINPKNGRLNAPKKSTYYPLMLRYYNEVGHIKTTTIDFNVGLEKMNQVADQVSKIWDVLSDDEKQYVINTFRMYMRIAFISSVQYSGLNKEVAQNEFNKVTSYFNTFANIVQKKVKGVVKNVIQSYNVETNIFVNVPQIDTKAIENATAKDYNPFKVERMTIA